MSATIRFVFSKATKSVVPFIIVRFDAGGWKTTNEKDDRMRNRVKATAGGSGGRSMLPVLLGCSFAASFSQSMMNIALPELAHEFSVTLSMANWLVVGYQVVAATAVTLAAFLLKRFGLRTVFFVGVFALAAGSGLAVFAPSFPILFCCRLVQAICSGLFYPVVTSAIMTVSPKGRLGTNLAMNSGVIALGLAVSPVVSGLVLTYFGRHAMFVVPLGLAIALFAIGCALLRNIGAREQVSADPLSVALSLVGLGALMYGLSEFTHDLVFSIAALAGGITVLAVFVRRQFTAKAPLLNLRPLGHPRFALGLTLVMVGTMISFSLSVLLPLYFEGAVAYSAFFAGLLMLGPVVANAVCSVAGGKLFDRRGIWPMLPLGFAVVLAGLLGVFSFSKDLLVVAVVALCAVAYVGLGFVVSPSKTTALDQLPADLYPYGASINSTFTQIASAIGPSLFVGVLSSDVLRDTAAGLAKAYAYAAAFSHALTLAIGIALAGLVLAFLYARSLRGKDKR